MTKIANSKGRVNDRLIKSVESLKDQRKKFAAAKQDKVLKNGTQVPYDVELKRMDKEIAVLESRIVSPDVARSTRTKKKR